MNGTSKLITRLYLVCGIGLLSILFLLLLNVLFISPGALIIVKDINWDRASYVTTTVGFIPALVSAIAMAAYALFFYRLQREVNIFNANNAKDNRLIEISNQWNSLEFVRARNQADLTIKNIDRPKIEIYNFFCQQGRIDDWIDLSLIAHFIERLGILLADGQIDLKKTQAEFKEAMTYWAVELLPFYADQDGASTTANINKAVELLNKPSD